MTVILKVSKLAKSFAGVKAVQDLHFEIKRNSITGLIGPNGAGKTTAFNLVTHFLRRSRGVIIFNSKSLNHMSPDRIVRRGIARTFQQIRLWPNLTVRENLLLACSRRYDRWYMAFVPRNEVAENKRVDEILKHVGLTQYAEQLAGDLSYGQSKLIEIARAFLTDAELILLDEPASGINPTMLHRVEQLIFDLQKQGKTLLVIEHNMPFLMGICDEIIAMHNGQFMCQDIPSKVQKNPQVLEAYLGGHF